MIDHINAIVVAVRDVEKCAMFYRDKLGFDLRQLDPDEAYLQIDPSGGVVLAIESLDLLSKEISEERMRPREEGIKRNHCVVFVKDVDEEYKELTGKGVHFVNVPKTLGDSFRTAHFEDPEGNMWEIAQNLRG